MKRKTEYLIESFSTTTRKKNTHQIINILHQAERPLLKSNYLFFFCFRSMKIKKERKKYYQSNFPRIPYSIYTYFTRERNIHISIQACSFHFVFFLLSVTFVEPILCDLFCVALFFPVQGLFGQKKKPIFFQRLMNNKKQKTEKMFLYQKICVSIWWNNHV